MREELQRRLRARARDPRRRRSLRMRVLVAGGAGEDRLEHMLELTGEGDVRVARRDRPGRRRTGEGATRVDAETVAETFELLADGLPELVRRDEARFLPDSTIGTLDIDVDGDVERFYFLADPRHARQPQERPGLDRIVGRIDRLTDEALGEAP